MGNQTRKNNLKLFRGRFRTKSLRKLGRDYSEPGNYFVTICAKDRTCLFGEIRNNIMGLNDLGCIVAEEIQRTTEIRSGVMIDRWVVMPNHLHLIIKILPVCDNIVETSRRDVSTGVTKLIPLPRLRPRSLGAIINHIKSASTKRIRRLGHSTFAWQPRYYDKIIRHEEALNAARNYIVLNPSRWLQDRNYQI